eukprot:scaffold655982_cov78-Prasinocladus_malaysianus.AAC.1
MPGLTPLAVLVVFVSVLALFSTIKTAHADRPTHIPFHDTDSRFEIIPERLAVNGASMVPRHCRVEAFCQLSAPPLTGETATLKENAVQEGFFSK